MRTVAGWYLRQFRTAAGVACVMGIGAGVGDLSRANDGEQVRLERLLQVYAPFIQSREGNVLVMMNGQRVQIEALRPDPSPEARIAQADLKDMVAQAYVPGRPSGAPRPHDDPGRARSGEFFNAVYGDCRKGEVTPHLVTVPWVPGKGGRPVAFSQVNGAADRLAAVSSELDQLPSSFDIYLLPPAGTYNCRTIAGTHRPSPHGYGIAIDIALPRADYWQWGNRGAAGPLGYRNRIPFDIVDIFERHGFIWGGKWAHFDTMHFEYRPELLPPTAALGGGRAR